MRRVTRLLDQAVRQTGVGHLELAFPDEPAAWRAGLEAGKHHMGATRMHVDPGTASSTKTAGSTERRTCSSPELRISERGVRESHTDDRRVGARLGDHLKRVVAGL